MKKNQIFKISVLCIFSMIFKVYGLLAQSDPLPKVSSGSIKRFANFPSKFVDARDIDVWLPNGYTPEKKYAVLYMHDGKALYDSTIFWNKQEWGVDETMGSLIADKQIKDCIVVGIWNNEQKRHQEYFPQKPFYSMTEADQQKILAIGRDKNKPLIGDGPIADRYLKFLVTELKPFIDSNFSTLTDRKNTFIAGSSMGGLISMYAICEYPDIFGGAACLSTHWTGIFTNVDNPIPASFLQYLKMHIPSPKTHKLYFDYGSETLDSLYKPYQLQADAIIKAAGYTSKNWITREFPGENHSEKSWAKRFHIPVQFLLKK